ncbi:Bro-N domain-containing protein [Klebsiella pneumoniae]|uniref:BRO-N domain-containing protein n=1 Tax=Klebsiella pneumoniae TaxID=573 RepID=UPI00292C9E46|nr:BRO family protein [Klebsiella pneumoniae]MDV0975889.1 BRO family protein [Klebsiella pneumoniae]
MNNQLTTFDFNSLSIRVVEREGEPWFVAADVCKALGIKNPSVAVKPLGSDEWAKCNLGQRGLGAALAVSESGLYKPVMRSDKPEARAFQDWVTKVVLPAIQKKTPGVWV